MTADATERSNYFVYLYRIGGVMAYVGSGSGFRMTKHLRASHNPQLSEWIARAQENGDKVQRRKIKRGLTKDDALRLEGRCFEKWRNTLSNKNHPYPALEWERLEAAWANEEEWEGAADHREWMQAVEEMYDGTLSREKALEYGFIDAEGRVTYGDRDLYGGP
jgi:hypothetical protein